MLMIGLAKSADIIHYLKGMMLVPSAGVHGRSKILQMIKSLLSLLDILFPETIIKIYKLITPYDLYNTTTTQSIRHKEKI